MKIMKNYYEAALKDFENYENDEKLLKIVKILKDCYDDNFSRPIHSNLDLFEKGTNLCVLRWGCAEIT